MPEIGEIPTFHKMFINFFDNLPGLNTTSGILLYCTVFYMSYMLILFIHAFYKRDETRAKIKDETEFRKNLEVVRKVKDAEAKKLLNKLYKPKN